MSILTGVVPAPARTDEQQEESTSPSGITRLWDDWRASGVWRTDYFRSSKSFDDATGLVGTTMQLKVLPELTPSIDGKLEIRATNTAINDGGSSRVRLLEGYARIRFEKADLFLGNQIVAWGRADGLNPTDNLTPRDFTVLLPFEDDQRFGTAAAKLDMFLSQEHTLTVFATPFFEPAEVPIPAAAGEMIKNEPAQTLSNTEVGVRLNRVGADLDWSVSYYRGFSLLPNARLLAGGAAEPVTELHYDRISVLGADFARNYGRFGVRGEVAYVDGADDEGTNPGIRNSYLYWIAGVDRTFYENLNVNLQFFQRRVRRYQDPTDIADPQVRGVAFTNALIHVQQDRIGDGVSFRVSNQWLNETLEAELFVVTNITRDNSLLRPVVTYAFSDHWKATLGGEFYLGSEGTQYGSLKNNSGAFLEVRYGF